MTDIPASEPKGKGSINKFRDDCRKMLREYQHPELTNTRKLVLLRLVDYLHSDDRIAWPDFDTLAADVGVHRATAISAVNVAKKLEIVLRIKKGGKRRGRGISNRYVFRLDTVARQQPCQDTDIVAGEYLTQSHASTRHSSTRATLSSNDLLTDNLIGTSAAALESGVGAPNTKVPEDSEKRSGEGTEAPPTTSDNPITERVEMPKQTDAELCIEMAARGLDMSRSKFRRGQSAPEVYSLRLCRMSGQSL